jgi:hypothetical protein
MVKHFGLAVKRFSKEKGKKWKEEWRVESGEWRRRQGGARGRGMRLNTML